MRRVEDTILWLMNNQLRGIIKSDPHKTTQEVAEILNINRLTVT